VLRQRFTQLSPNIVGRLRIAAIIGRTFDLSLLATVEGQEPEVLEEDLLDAARAGLIRTDQAGSFTFNHDKIRECLYAEVSTSRRRRLHEAIGRVLESRYDLENTRNMHQLAELAFHFTQSGDRARGVTYSQRAAEQATQSFAFKEAVTYYYLALELIHQDDTRRSNLLLGLGEAALLANSEGEAAVACKEALALFSQSGEREAAARAAHGLALAQWRQESLQGARVTLEHALALLGDNQSARGVRILVDLATLLTHYMDHHIEGMTYAQRALEMALRLGDSSLEAAANRAVAGKLYAPGNDMTFASHSLERALELAEAGDDSSEAAECCFSLARAYYWLAEIERSQAVSTRMVEFIERSQQPYQLRNALPWLALLHASQGEWDEAEQAIERARPVVEHLTSSFPSAFLHQIRGFLAYQREDYETAESEFRVATVDQHTGPERLMFFTGLFGLAQVALGKKEEAYAYAGRLEALLSELPTGTLPTAPIMTCLALMALSVGDREQAAKLYPILKAFRGQHHWFLVDRALGLLATLLKDWDMAAMYLVSAKNIALRAGLRPELARTLLAYADFEVERGGQGSITRATDSLQQALTLFEKLKMTAAATHVRHRLRTLSQRSLALQFLPADLTKSEAKVLQIVTMGKSNRQIARELGISEKTVANHLTHIFAKTKSENRAAAAAFAIRHGLA
jgi:DNA-binding CsgD family transcriptional regulator/predicted ATPase